MKQTFTSARRPLEILIHIIGWGIMFGFPFFSSNVGTETSTGGLTYAMPPYHFLL